MHQITWSNGSVDRARTWRAMFEKVRAYQWHDLDEEEFRAEMGKRCWLWSNTTIDIGAPYAQFFRELQRAGLIYIEGSK